MLRRIAVSTAISLLAVSVSAGAQPRPEHAACSLHVHITDEDGAAIKAFVFVHSDRWVKINQQMAVDPKGESRINLRSGLYDLFVSAPGFVPIAQIVDLRSCKPLDVNLMMALDSEHVEGDQF